MKTISKESCKELLISAFSYFPSDSKMKNQPPDFKQLAASDFDVLATYIEETIGVSTTGKSIKALLKGAGAKNSTINIICAFLLVKKGVVPVQDLNFEENAADNRYYVRRYFEVTSEKNKLVDSAIIERQSIHKPFYKTTYFYLIILLLFAITILAIYQRTEDKTILPEIQELSVVDKSGYFPKEIKIKYDLKSEKFLNDTRIGVLDTPILLSKLKGDVYLTAHFPDLYWVSLYSNKNIFDIKKILLPSNGWRAYLNRTNSLSSEDCMVNGLMHLQNKSVLNKPDEEYYTSFNIFENFGADGDNFMLEADIKNPPEEGGHWAYDISVDIIGYENPVTFNFLSPDAIKYANLIVGSTDFKVGERQEVLKNLGILLPDWQHLTVSCKNKKINIMLDDQVIINEYYEGVIGKVVGLQFYFKGSGYVKNVKLNGMDVK